MYAMVATAPAGRDHYRERAAGSEPVPDQAGITVPTLLLDEAPSRPTLTGWAAGGCTRPMFGAS